MATKRFRNGKFRYVVKNKKLLPHPINLSFENEADGDAYVAELEDLLSRGIVPLEFLEGGGTGIRLHELIRNYISAISLKDDDRKLMQLHAQRLTNFDVGKITLEFIVPPKMVSGIVKPLQ